MFVGSIDRLRAGVPDAKDPGKMGCREPEHFNEARP